MAPLDLIFIALVGVLAFFGICIFIFSIKRLSAPKQTSEGVLDEEVFNKDKENELVNKVNERFSYSLDMRDALDEVVDYLKEFVSFSTASYVLIEGNKLIFKANLMIEVSPAYINVLKEKLIERCNSLYSGEKPAWVVEEFIVGGPLTSDSNSKVGSYFDVPIYAGGEFLGVICVASTKENLYGKPSVALVERTIKTVMESLIRLRDVVEREKEKLQAMVDSMNDGVLLIDKNFTILVVNPAIYRLLGVDLNSSLNILDITEYFSKAFSLEEKISKVFATGGSETLSGIELGDKYYEVVVVPVKSEKETMGAGIIIHDQTKEEELKRLQREFSAMVIHELRSPLSVIRGTSDLLLGEYEKLSHDQFGTFLTQIRESAVNLLDMVNDLLDAAKVEAGKIELFRKPINITALLTDACNYYLNLASQSGISISAELDDSVGMVSADEKKLRQVMSNLLSNALKFTERGGTIIVRSKDTGTHIEISVSDTGKGVPDDLKDKIFEKYVQGRQAKTEGTGLGLVIVKGIVEAHGGKIWIEDNQPKGAKFIFTIAKKETSQ